MRPKAAGEVRVLHDAGRPMAKLTPQQLFERLDALGIGHHTVTHPPLFTVQEARALRGDLAGGHTKNLFLKDRKDNYFLLTLEEDAEIDLKRVHVLIGASGRVSFGRPDMLMALLGVEPGAVSVFCVANDVEGRVKLVLDEALMRHPVINAHPLVNTATTAISREDLVRFAQSVGHTPLVLKRGA
jgi:Ala-tRNA(Pro) deacylase